MQALLPGMKAAGFGRIVNMSSRAALGKELRTAYAATKADLIGMTRVWALELGPHGITANAIGPRPHPHCAVRPCQPARRPAHPRHHRGRARQAHWHARRRGPRRQLPAGCAQWFRHGAGSVCLRRHDRGRGGRVSALFTPFTAPPEPALSPVCCVWAHVCPARRIPLNRERQRNNHDHFHTPHLPDRPPQDTLAVLASLAAGTAALPGAALRRPLIPPKPISIVVPFSAGGTTDILARLVGQYLSTELGQPVVIENKAGAGGNIGGQYAAKAAADGYTLFMGTVGTQSINASLYKKMPFDPIKDFAPLTRVANVPNLLVANPQQPFKTVPEMIAYAKANPGKISFGSPGNGASPHLSGELFNAMAKVELTHIPYKGSAPAVTDLLGNQIAIMFDNLPSVIPHVRSGKLRAIAITTAKRSARAARCADHRRSRCARL